MTQQATDYQESSKNGTYAAKHLEQAVKTNDEQGYKNAMNEVQEYLKTHSYADSQTYSQSLKSQLDADKMLGHVALYEAKEDFGKLSEDDGRLHKSDLTAAQGRTDLNDVQKSLLKEVDNEYGQLHNNTWKMPWDGTVSKEDLEKGIQNATQTEKNQGALQNLFQKNEQGVSLYDKISDANGNVDLSKVADLQRLGKSAGLCDQDQESLKLLMQTGETLGRVDHGGTQITYGALKKEDVQKVCADNGLNMSDLQNQPANGAGNSDSNPGYAYSTRNQLDAKTVQAKQDLKDLQDKMNGALQVKNGESYAQSAEKLLEMAGVDPTGKQIRDLAHKLWLADNKRKAGGLTHGQHLEMTDEILSDPSLSGLRNKLKTLETAAGESTGYPGGYS